MNNGNCIYASFEICTDEILYTRTLAFLTFGAVVVFSVVVVVAFGVGATVVVVGCCCCTIC